MDESTTELLKIADPRMNKFVAIRRKSDSKVLVLQRKESFEIQDTNLRFTSPNNVAICLSITKKNMQLAQRYYKENITPKLNKKGVYDFSDDDVIYLYDYFENIQTSLIFIYTAIECFINLAIPDNYIYERKNSKKIKESYDKEAIERWISTSEKMNEIIPAILKIDSPKNQKWWTSFTKLEEIRNEIIHQKTTRDMSFFKEFLSIEIFNVIYSGLEIIKYFCDSDIGNPSFPYGFHDNTSRCIEVNEFEDYIEIVEELKPNND